MQQFENGHRYKDIDLWEIRKNQPYDYTKYGVLRHLMSPRIINSKNRILQTCLKYVEGALVICMKYVDILYNYDNYMRSNR